MLLTEAKAVIENAGFVVNEVETLKGSCIIPGLSIGEGSVKPTIYGRTVADMDEKELLRFIHNAMDQLPEFDPSKMFTKEYILDHCISCVRHQTDDEKAVKWSVYGDLEEYVRVDLGHNDSGSAMSVVVTESLLESTGIKPEELREYARKNLKGCVVIKSMGDVLSSLMGMPADPFIPASDNLMYVATTTAMLHGASVMLLDDVLTEFCFLHHLKSVYIIPSSLHEVLLIPADQDMDIINNMIQEVNLSEVDETDRLSDHVYLFTAEN